jgi:osmotically-inducible protein OsmY
MRKYGKWLLVLGVMAASPVAASADGFLGGRLKPQMPFSGSAEKARNQAKAEEVANALKSADVRGTDIEIEVRDGVAILNGKVSEASQRALAQRTAATVPGVQRVENNLRFVPPAGGQVERASSTRTADAPQKPVTQAALFEAAENQSRSIQKVSAELPAAGPGNQAVAQQIADSLSQMGLVGYDIEIRYNNGVATLAGEVATVGQRQAASAAVSQIAGVQSVNNQLRVSGPISQTAYGPGAMPMAAGQPNMMQQQMMQQQMMMQGQGPQGPMTQAGYMQPGMQMDPRMAPSPTGYAPTSFNHPQLPSHAWPSYAQYPNSAAVSYPTQYSASAWPYIGPFYPYPQVPMGWREVSLEWDDGQWQLNFNKEKDKWYWVLHPKNW